MAQIPLSLPAEHVALIVDVLSTQPYAKVASVILAIVQQVQQAQQGKPGGDGDG